MFDKVKSFQNPKEGRYLFVTLSHWPSRREATKLLKISGGDDPQANLSVAPAPLNSGSQGTITIRAPANAVGFRLAKRHRR
jgi:hypothetical protein